MMAKDFDTCERLASTPETAVLELTHTPKHSQATSALANRSFGLTSVARRMDRLEIGSVDQAEICRQVSSKHSSAIE